MVALLFCADSIAAVFKGSRDPDPALLSLWHTTDFCRPTSADISGPIFVGGYLSADFMTHARQKSAGKIAEHVKMADSIVEEAAVASR